MKSLFRFRLVLWNFLLIIFLLSNSALCVLGRTVKIASYNVENFFDGYDDPYAYDTDRYANDKLLVKPENEKRAVADVLKGLNADIIGLQEVENRGVLEEFNRKYLASLGYKYVELLEGNDSRGIDVALLSRFPLGPATSYRHLPLYIPGQSKPSRFSRDLLEVVVYPPGTKPFTVFVAHLKSRSGGKPAEMQRNAEAKKIRDIWDARLKAKPNDQFIFLCDCNDDPLSETIRILKGSGTTSVHPVKALSEDGQNWTQHSKRENTPYSPILFDYIFLSPSMSKMVKSAGILRSKKGTEQWEQQRLASDHFPVWAVLNLK